LVLEGIRGWIGCSGIVEPRVVQDEEVERAGGRVDAGGREGKAVGLGCKLGELGFVERELAGSVVLAGVGVGHQIGHVEALGRVGEVSEELLAGDDHHGGLAIRG
jgi:hypothetical protein